mgnify:CR=1 FL=1
MKREDLKIDDRIAEALSAAAGNSGKAAAIQGEGDLGLGREDVTATAGVGTALAELALRLEGLAKPAATAGAGGWQGLVSNLNPILGGILRLFGGGGEEPVVSLPMAARPTTARYDMGFAGGDSGYFYMDRDAAGGLRTVRPSNQPAVVVQVEAMDSRSFLERTPEIAEALRRALLESEGMQSVLSNWQE